MEDNTMDTNKKQNQKIEEQAEQKHSERRKFLKKVAYTTPKLMALGYLTRPKNANANLNDPSTPAPPSGGNW